MKGGFVIDRFKVGSLPRVINKKVLDLMNCKIVYHEKIANLLL